MSDTSISADQIVVAAVYAAALAHIGVLMAVWCLSLMVLFWVAGFDVIYALQDLEFDRGAGLHSIPAWLGVKGAVWTSRGLHAVAFFMLVVAWLMDGRLGWLFGAGVGIVGALLVSEHIVLGPSAGAEGIMGNPRDYALPGNQDPAMPWPSSLVLLSAIAAATTRMRLTACAVIAPLRHPLLLARELGTLDLLSEGRLVVQPTVSWHRDEYDALGVPFSKRGTILDEHLAAWAGLWRDTPASFAGEHYAYDEVYFEPKAWRPDGPRLWLGGESVHPRLLRRIVRYAHAHPTTPVDRLFLGSVDRLRIARSRGRLSLSWGTTF